jgi:flavodoxin
MERLRFFSRFRPLLEVENEQELAIIRNALSDFFAGSSFSFDTTLRDGKYQITKIPPGIVIQKITYNDTTWWNDPFFQFLCSRLSNEEQLILQEAGKAGKILMIRRTKPGAEDEFIQAVKNHSMQFHQGFSPYTELILTGYYNGHTYVEEEEKAQLEKIKQTAQNAIKFYSLVEEDKGLKDIIDKINQESNRYELIYYIYLALAALNRSNNRMSFFSILLGIGGIPLLEEISKTWGDFYSQVTSQMTGEMIAMITAAGDRIAEQLFSFTNKEKMIKQYLGLIGQSFKNLPSHLKKLAFDQAKEFSITRQKILQRLFVLGLTTTSAIILSGLSQYTNTLTPYALIPALNTFLITAYEIYERSKAVKNLSDNLSDEEFELLIEKIPKPLQPLFKKLPRQYTVAYLDFATNNYAFGALVGSFLATFSVFALQNFEIPKEIIYGLSGMIFEPLTAIVYGQLKQEDPYEKFCENLPY